MAQAATGVFKVNEFGVLAADHVALAPGEQDDAATLDIADKLAAIGGISSEYFLKATDHGIFVVGERAAANQICSALYGQPMHKANNDNRLSYDLADVFNKSHSWASNIFNPAALGGAMPHMIAAPEPAAPRLAA